MLHSTMAEPITGRQRYEPVLDGAFVHFSQRFTARFVGSDAMETNGQYSDDGGTTWHDDFTMSCRRIG